MKRFEDEILEMPLADLITLKNHLDERSKTSGSEASNTLEFIRMTIDREIEKRIGSWAVELEQTWKTESDQSR